MIKIQEKFKVSDDNVNNMIMSADAAFEEYKKKYEESLKVVDPGVIPIGSNVLLTTRILSIEESGRFLVANEFSVDSIKNIQDEVSEEQIVISVGKDAREVQPGDRVKFNISDFVRVKNPGGVNRMEVNELPIERIGDRYYLLMHERSLKFIFKRE